MATATTQEETCHVIRELHPTLGAQVGGVDTSQPLDANTISNIGALIDRHAVLVFADQQLSDVQLNAFAAQFGDTNQQPPSASRHHVNNVTRLGHTLDRSAEELLYNDLPRFWHSDSSWRAIPTWITFLYCIECPSQGGETCFADLRAAYEALPQERKEFLEGIQVVHSWANLRHCDPQLPPMGEDIPRPVTHPIVRTIDGRKSLFITMQAAYYVGNMDTEEGEKVYAELIEHATAPQFVLTHKWKPGDLVVWDNRRTIHKVLPFDKSIPRLMHRAEVKGTEAPS